jgi:hypothetical protein
MDTSPPREPFREGYVEFVAHSIKMTIDSESFLDPAPAVASVYLATRFENYFRHLSGKLGCKGEWLSPQHQAEAVRDLSVHTKSVNRPQISNVSIAYKVMMLRKDLPIVAHLKRLDENLAEKGLKQSFSIDPHVSAPPMKDQGDRIGFGRNEIAHGEWGDMTGESLYYCLLTCLLFCHRDES